MICILSREELAIYSFLYKQCTSVVEIVIYTKDCLVKKLKDVSLFLKDTNRCAKQPLTLGDVLYNSKDLPV